jgi:wyosine [tRNA(Phe)-imidazoG37] synthetase (radical SAM superfamily)
MPRRFIFGPVPSRRLGMSLGVDVVPYKLCTLDCLYCELGPTTRSPTGRAELAPDDEVLAELRAVLERLTMPLDWITFSGSGEPTLHLGLGRLIRAVAALGAAPVAVLTNGTLLGDPAVQADLAAADLVVPSLDAGLEETFQRVNRPRFPGLSVAGLVAGLTSFTRGFAGQVWVEVLLLAGLNDTPAELAALTRHLESIQPHRVQVGTLVRPPAHTGATTLEPASLEQACATLRAGLPGIQVESIAPPHQHRPAHPPGAGPDDPTGAILAYLRRRPGTVEDLASSLGRPPLEILKLLDQPELRDRLRRRVTDGLEYLELEPPAAGT